MIKFLKEGRNYMNQIKECIFCFFTDKNQKKLQKQAQLQEEKFEDILKRYKELFTSNFFNSLDNPVCEKHIKILNKEQIIEKLKSDRRLVWNLEEFFENLVKIYKLWISGEAHEAISNLTKKLYTYKLLKYNDNKFDIQNRLFFRGRKEGNIIYNKYDMFHIPYDKRYLVKNQRFSLSGYPLLYLNRSLKGVKAELEIGNNINEFLFSSFYFRRNAKIYEMANPFKEIYNSEDDIGAIPNLATNELHKRVLKLVLLNTCLFEKRLQHIKLERKGFNVFYEEYVLPQALTQVLKIRKFDGIFYPSTRINEYNENYIADEINFNLVLFPKYQENRHYDNELFENTEISSPLCYDDLKFHDSPKKTDYELLRDILLNMYFKTDESNENYSITYFFRIFEMLNNHNKLIEKYSLNNENIIKIENILRYNFIQKEIIKLDTLERRKNYGKHI